MGRQLMPPRLREWKAGHQQIGLFIRTKEGGVIEATSNNASPEACKLAAELLLRLIEKKE